MFKKYKKKYKFVVFFISILFCSNDKPGLISYEITNGKILSQTHFPRSDIYEFHMSNGATVFFKKINSSSNEILFKSFSLGGKSVLSKNELVNAAIIPDLINQSFYEKYNYLDLNTELSDISKPGRLISFPEPDETLPTMKNLFLDRIFSASS